jgi:hypothetical protein
MEIGFEELKRLLDAWVDALKVMDTKLNAYYSALGALENSEFKPAAPYFMSAVRRSQNDPLLASQMKHKYDSARRQLEEKLRQSHPAEAVSAWLREYQLEKLESQ